MEASGVAEADRIARLTARMLNLGLYGIRYVLREGRRLEEGRLADHLEYMVALENEGVLFASGPLADAEGRRTGDGLAFVRAVSADAARAIAAADPFVVDGVRDAQIFGWTVMEGRLAFEIDLSECSMRLK